jgi:hypothetical protein
VPAGGYVLRHAHTPHYDGVASNVKNCGGMVRARAFAILRLMVIASRQPLVAPAVRPEM